MHLNRIPHSSKTLIYPITISVLFIFSCLVTADGNHPALQKISDHVYSYIDIKDPSPAGNSFGANAGVIIGKDAALVVDTLISAKEGKRFLDEIRKITDKPVKYVVNTHYHLDHAWGNITFVQAGAVVIAHDNSRLATPKAEYGLAHASQYNLTPADLEGTVLSAPTVTFPDHITVDLGDLLVELSYPGPTHTDGSITVNVPKEKVIFIGDIVFNRYHPFLGDGDLENWPKVLDTMAKTLTGTIIPGHGPAVTKTDLEDMRDYLRIFDKQAKILCKGKKADDAAAIAQEMLKRLPQQHRDLLPNMVMGNLSMRYLPQPKDAAK